jgi:CRISPR-associated protein Cas1
MEKRIIDLSEEPASLSVRLEQLIIRRGDKEDSVPLEDLAVIIAAHPAICFTHAVLSGLCKNGGIFILCNEKRLPTGMLLPLEGHTTQTERLAAQVNIPIATQKKLWKYIIKAKVNVQARILNQFLGDDMGLSLMARKIRSGDESNIEAQAARRYWLGLFGVSFHRTPAAEDAINSLLNYGYAVLRAIIARAIVSTGLHPSLGIHHHNRYDAFCLADDLMEPFRPYIDGAVKTIFEERGADVTLDKESKAILINSIVGRRFILDGESRSFFDVAGRLASSLANVYMGNKTKLEFPEW